MICFVRHAYISNGCLNNKAEEFFIQKSLDMSLKHGLLDRTDCYMVANALRICHMINLSKTSFKVNLSKEV